MKKEIYIVYFKVFKVKTLKKFNIFTELAEVFTQPLKYPETSKMDSNGIWGNPQQTHTSNQSLQRIC